MNKSSKEGIKILANNRKARYHYTVLDTLECGIELRGTEVKSMKNGQFSFSDSYAKIDKGELWLMEFHITPYDHGNQFNHEPGRARKLLIHKQEVKRLKRRVDEKGLTLVPLKFYLKRGLVKLEIGLCRGKKVYDKREEIKKQDLKRDQEREIKLKY